MLVYNERLPIVGRDMLVVTHNRYHVPITVVEGETVGEEGDVGGP